jgi:hypothetical protein
MKNKDITTISVKRDTKVEFDKLGKKTDSSDTVLKKLIITFKQTEDEGK